jgi:sugar (pentulose or hexulose) kinase
LLQNGMVLVAGGSDSNTSLASAELYDPASGTWTATGSLNTAHAAHTATLLPNPIMVLIAGGFADGRPLSRAELGRGRR